MKRTHYILIVIFGFLTSQSIILVGGSTEWTASISTSHYNWKSTLNQFSDTNLYPDGDLVGGINSPGGDIQINLKSIPSNNFSFFEGDRLDSNFILSSLIPQKLLKRFQYKEETGVFQ